MAPDNYLVVGGSGVAGQSAMQAIRAHDPAANILTTTSKAKQQIAGATSVFANIDFATPAAVSSLLSQIKTPIDGLIFTPAFGAVGFAAAAATAQQINEAKAVSLSPLVELQRELRPTLAIAFSTFYWLADAQRTYGAMAAIKRELEALAIESHGSLKVIRAGAFVSRSAKALALAVYQQIRRGKQPELAEAKPGPARLFFDFFFARAWQAERAAYGHRFDEPHRATEPEDLVTAIRRLLAGEEAPVLNVIGDWQWTDEQIES